MEQAALSKCYVDVKAVSSEGTSLAVNEYSIVVSRKSTYNQVVEQLKRGFKFGESTSYEVIHNGRGASLETIVESCTEWLNSGEEAAFCEYANATDGRIVYVHLTLRVMADTTATMTTAYPGGAAVTMGSVKRKRDHKPWAALAMEVGRT
jgi:hypothetical protein